MKRCSEFCAKVDEFLAHTYVSEDDYFNYDETRVMVTMDGSVFVEATKKSRPAFKGSKGKTIGTMLSFIRSNGTIFMSVWIFKSTKVADNGVSSAEYFLKDKQPQTRS